MTAAMITLRCGEPYAPRLPPALRPADISSFSPRMPGGIEAAHMHALMLT